MPSNSDFDTIVRETRQSIAQSAADFDANAILRGMQLTIVGALRALQNPELFKYEACRQAALAVCAGIAVRLFVTVPIVFTKITLWVLSYFINFEVATWDDAIIGGLDFIANYVLNVPFFLMTMFRYMAPTLDHVFMDSLKWVDRTYAQKHKSEEPSDLRAMATTSLVIYALSFLPWVGRLVLPAASFYTFNKAVGLVPASFIFGAGLFLPKEYLVNFLQTYFASRGLMRELLDPYFSRIMFNREQKSKFFRDREGVLFGFGVGFYIFSRIPLLGVLIYGVAEASTAYLITKITDPPPPPAEAQAFAESQARWSNKHKFLHLSIGNLDANNIQRRQAVSFLNSPRNPSGKRYS